MTWGLLPVSVVHEIERREWQNSRNLRARLSGTRPFPLRFGLKAPSGEQALADLEHFRQFIASWKNWPHAHQVHWQRRNYQRLGEHDVPVALQIDSMPDLIALLGPEAEARSRIWEQRMSGLLAIDARLSKPLLKHLDAIEGMAQDDSDLLAKTMPQLRPGLGQGTYLRSLPLEHVDTKFVEDHKTLLAELLDCLYENGITEAGGLLKWLDCRENPSGWLQVRPLCARSREGLAGLPVLQLDMQTLRSYPLHASRILVIENYQSGYALPELDDTIAVFGGGGNTAWMDAEWLRGKQIGYWGDIDSWGLTFLSEARGRQPHIRALMMDEETLLQHQRRMVEDTERKPLPKHLTEAERQLFERLQSRFYGKTRLEQERLAPDYLFKQLHSWLQIAEKPRCISNFQEVTDTC